MKNSISCSIIKNSCAANVASVEDLVIEILSRIPIKSLIRFKLVSKHWSSLIINAKFCRRRIPKSKSAVGLFIRNGCQNSKYDYISLYPHESKFGPSLNLNHTLDPRYNGVSDSCNGLLLCYVCSKHCKYYVYNPTTNQSSIIPIPQEIFLFDGCQGCNTFLGMTLVFDAVKSLHYSIVCVLPPCENERVGKNYRIRVYSSLRRTWKIAVLTEKEAKYEKGVFYKGSVHWLNTHPGSKPSLRLVVDQQVLVDMPVVPILRCCRLAYFGQSNDHLHYITEINGLYDVFEIKDDYSEWLLKYKMNLNELPQGRMDPFWYSCWHKHGYEGCCAILCLVRGEKEADSFLVVRLFDEIVKYNLINKNVEHIYSSKYPMAYFGNQGIQYIESLHCC